MNEPRFTNRLRHETSPYLKQHAHNPVDWYPWGAEALARAKELNRPIFLSIGYSACHWCHVMEHESFENEQIAQVLNEHFVSIKVDREERPDLDQIYMTAVQLMTGQGGWPMSVFLTPDLQPFYGGTYFPPDDKYGRPGFNRLLLALVDAWKNRQDSAKEQAGQITQHIQAATQTEAGTGTPGLDAIKSAVVPCIALFDSRYGGFGQAPKFPHAIELRLLLRASRRFDDPELIEMCRFTLDRMARGGMYDQLGGGFHRYSTDERWLAPHFEKMLYDNALLSQAYLEAYQATGEPFYRQIVEETLDYVLREMTSPEGAFYSTQDADSEGVEGKFYVWTAEEIEQVLGKEQSEVFSYVYDVSPSGNWEGHNILWRTKTDEQDAKLTKVTVPRLREILDLSKKQLLEVRGKRIWPGRDEKILTAWNAIMLTSFAEAAQVLASPRYAEAATRAANFLLTKMGTADGKLYRTTKIGAAPKLNAYLEDYAYLANALVSLYETTFEARWLKAALELADVMNDQFWDADQFGYFFTGKDHETLITRVKDFQDSSTPSGNSMAATALVRLGRLTGRQDLLERAEQTMRAASSVLAKSAMAGSQMLIVLDFQLGPVQEFAIVGDVAAESTQRVLKAIRTGFRPHKVVALKPVEGVTDVPLLEGKTAQGEVTTYICENFACQAPLVGTEALEKALAVRVIKAS